jgi:hypothetical protein
MHSNHTVREVVTMDNVYHYPLDEKIEHSQFGIYFRMQESSTTKLILFFIPWSNISKIIYHDITN